MTASRTTPTLWVLVIMTGPSRNPDSSTQVVPVISPLPLRVNHAGEDGVVAGFAARMNRGDAGANRAFADFQFAFAGDQRGVADLDSLHISDGIIGARSAVKRNAKVTGAGFGLSCQRCCYRENKEKRGPAKRPCEHGASKNEVGSIKDEVHEGGAVGAPNEA